MTPDLALAYIHPGTVSGRFCASLARVVKHVPRVADIISLQSSPRIAEARSQIVDLFAATDHQWLLMVDADMVFDEADVNLILEAADPTSRPIVGGLCFTNDGPDKVKPVMHRLLDGGDVETITDWPRGELIEVDTTGAAFLLVHRQVFAAMKAQFGQRADGSENPYPWFVEGMVTKNGMKLGEDTAFLMRARAMGIPVHVHTGTKIGHEKAQVLTEEMYG